MERMQSWASGLSAQDHKTSWRKADRLQNGGARDWEVLYAELVGVEAVAAHPASPDY
jgi:hypothetical protein